MEYICVEQNAWARCLSLANFVFCRGAWCPPQRVDLRWARGALIDGWIVDGLEAMINSWLSTGSMPRSTAGCRLAWGPDRPLQWVWCPGFVGGLVGSIDELDAMALSIGQLPLSTGMSLIGKRARWPTFPSVVSFEALDKRSRKGDNLPASASASFLWWLGSNLPAFFAESRATLISTVYRKQYPFSSLQMAR